METIYKNENFEFKGYWNCLSKCEVQINVEQNGDIISRVVVILTELPDNPGTSITNAFESIATEIYHRMLKDIPIERIEWIEHYLGTRYLGETYDRVIMDWDGKKFYSPRWKHISGRRMK